MPKIRLRKGDEPVELSDKKLLIGVSSEFPVAPNTEAQITVNPQLAGIPCELLVDKATAEAFDLVDYRVGHNSQFVAADSRLSLAPFATEVEGFPECGELAIAQERYREVFDNDKCVPGMSLTFVVLNRNDKPLRFRGAALFRCAEY